MKDQFPHPHPPPPLSPTPTLCTLQVCRSFIDNLRLYLAGRPLQYLVDWTREY